MRRVGFHPVFKLQNASAQSALEDSMLDTTLEEEHAGIHSDLAHLRTLLAATRAALEGDSSAADSLRARVLEVVAGAEETARVLQINAARREVAGAQVRSLSMCAKVQSQY
jgi:hypothetical protein